MAIDANLPGITVEVCVEGHPLQEYPATTAEPASPGSANTGAFKSVSYFVKSEAGKEFAIKCVIDKRFTCDAEILGMDVFINNKPCVRRFVKKSVLAANDKFIANITGLRTVEEDELVFRSFKFVEIKRTEDEIAFGRVKDDKKVIDEVGAIVVEFWRSQSVEVEDSSAEVSDGIEGLYLNAGATFHEKALKGEPKYHNVILGDPKTVANAPIKTSIEKLGANPIISFTFNYRSELALRHLMIIERSPSPDSDRLAATNDSSFTPVKVHVNADNSTRSQRRKVEELARLQAEEFARQNLSNSRSERESPIKREHEDNEDEITPSKKRIRKSAVNEVIDLTDD